jgi:hypothetical protein
MAGTLDARGDPNLVFEAEARVEVPEMPER